MHKKEKPEVAILGRDDRARLWLGSISLGLNVSLIERNLVPSAGKNQSMRLNTKLAGCLNLTAEQKGGSSLFSPYPIASPCLPGKKKKFKARENMLPGV